MKIAFITNQLRRSGPINVLLEIVKNINKSHHEVHIFKLMTDDENRNITNDFLEEGVIIHSYTYSFLQLELKTKKVSKKVYSDILSISADVINTHGYHPVLLASCFEGNIPIVNTLHNIFREDYVLSKGYLLGHYMISRYKMSLNKLDMAIAISNTVKTASLNDIKIPIQVVYNGIDLSKYNKASPYEKKRLRNQFEIPENCTMYIAVGHLTKLKNPDKLIEAYRKAMDDKSDAVLIFAGQGNLLSRCKKLANSNIIFLGFRSDVSELLKCADYSICASSSEGFGLNFIESVASGVPVISSNIGPFKEFTDIFTCLKDIQFESANIQSMTEKIALSYNKHTTNLDLYNDDLKKCFSSNSMTDGYMSIFSSLINTSKS